MVYISPIDHSGKFLKKNNLTKNWG